MTAIGPNGARLVAVVRQCAQELTRTIAILGTCSGEQHHQHDFQYIEQRVALASIDFLAGIIAACPGGGDGLDALTVQAHPPIACLCRPTSADPKSLILHLAVG